MAGLNSPVLLMQAGALQVNGQGSPGWLSGNIASLAALGSVDCIFDLGANWDQYNYVQVSIIALGPSSGLSAASFYSDTVPMRTASAPKLAAVYTAVLTAAIAAAVTVAGGPVTVTLRPMGRFLFVAATNADAVNALGAASSVKLAAYPV